LEHGDGRIVYESLIICEYLDTVYPEHRLTPADPFVKAQHQFLVEMSTRLIKTFYKLMKKNDSDSANNFNASLNYFENILGNNFFGGVLTH
jgi:glutathione S-transferase